MNQIIKYNIPQTVKTRVFEIDDKALQTLLKTAKANVGLTIADIVNKLNINKTTVEHWFRTDDYFAYPDADIWFQLKELLNITTNEFDAALTTFDYHDCQFDMSNRVYDVCGIAPTLTATDVITIIERIEL